MTRQRKEILKKLDEVSMQEAAEYELGCGFFADKISEAFSAIRYKLEAELAATYNMSVTEYENMLYAVDQFGPM